MNTIQVTLHRVLMVIATQVFRHAQGSSTILFSTSAFTNSFWENFFRRLLVDVDSYEARHCSTLRKAEKYEWKSLSIHFCNE